MSADAEKPNTPEDVFEDRVAKIVAKLVERNSLSGREAKAVQSEADKLLNAVQEVIDARVKHHIDRVKFGAKVAAVCFGLFALFLVPEETRKAVGRLFVPESRIAEESNKAVSDVGSASALVRLREYISESATKGLPSAFASVAHTDGAKMVAESIADEVIRKRLESYFAEVESSRLTKAGPKLVVEYGSKPRLFDAVKLGEQFVGKPTSCGQIVPLNTSEPVAIIATPLLVENDRPGLAYFWYGCPGTYPTTWIRLENGEGQSEPIRVISVERGQAISEKGRPEVRLNYGAYLLASQRLKLPASGRSEVNVRVVKACKVGSDINEQADCIFSGQ